MTVPNLQLIITEWFKSLTGFFVSSILAFFRICIRRQMLKITECFERDGCYCK
ncbi:Hypothetical protein GbCGDNIH9_0101 [Granulibacter bethesdensis]|uniref:Uncharacterized protein n=1 Tax=Granulibacter bethesdensis TaxID=364410 RepID=A0AAC9KA78_9PROT|nr:Hypothetical protein GbCGDNIH9_0101 [Granulibacter bethesdensis]APH60899.1 Hypothetical protein GbCGDNIH8_8393 [Granulibacter bethesdensis]